MTVTAATADRMSAPEPQLRIKRRGTFAGAVLVLPLLLFLLVSFLGPIGAMLLRGVEDPEVSQIMPHTIASLRNWDGKEIPGEAAFAALVQDLRVARAERTLGTAASRLNNDVAGFQSMLSVTARRVANPFEGSPRDFVLAVDPGWGNLESWVAIKRASGPFTTFYLLSALDMRRDVNNDIVRQPENQRVFLTTLGRTFWVAGLGTLICLVLAYPLSALLASLPKRKAGLLLLFVLLPFWTSLMVRTAAWMVLLAQQGVVNEALVTLGIFGVPQQLLFSRFAVLISMVHILLPFMILPLYAVMQQIPPYYVRAAHSLGAGPIRALLRVWVPQTLPGIGAGCLMVFIQALGFYITPTLLGGGEDQMLSQLIGFYANQTVNWGLAAALSLLLLGLTAVLVAIYGRMVGFSAVRTS